MTDVFTGPQVAKLAGVPVISLSKHTGQGIVSPTVHRGEGNGTVSRWDLVDVCAITSFGALRPSQGSLDLLKSLFTLWHRPRARALVAAAAAEGGARKKLTGFIVVADGGGVYFETEGDLNQVVKKYGPRLYVVDAAELVRAVVARAASCASAERKMTGVKKHAGARRRVGVQARRALGGATASSMKSKRRGR